MFVLIGIMLLLTIQAVSAAGHSASEITLTVSPLEVQSYQRFTLSATAPGAKQLEIYYQTGTDPDATKYLWGRTAEGRDTWNNTTGWFAYATTVKFTARAKFGDEWTEYTQPVIMNVTVPYGNLEKVNLSTQFNVEAGKKISYSFDPVDHAETYFISICPAEGRCTNQVEVQPGENQYDVSSMDVGSYSMRISAYAIGWKYSTVSKSFEIVEGGVERPASPTVSIDENETVYYDKDKKTIFVDNPIAFRITTPAAEKIRYKVTGAVNYSPSEVWPGNYDGTAYRVYTYTTNRAGNYSIYFSVMVNGVWSLYSDPVNYTVEAKGTLAKPEIISVPDEVQVGTEMPIAIKVGENVNRYNITLFKVTGNNWETVAWTDQFVTPGTETINITMSLDGIAAGEYRLSVYAYGDGYEYSYNQDKTVRVTGELPDTPQAIADNTSIKRNESIKFTVTAPGAQKIRYQFYTGDYSQEQETNSNTTVIELNGKDIYWYDRIHFSASVNGIWSAWSEWINFTVAELKLDTPVITVSPKQVKSGESVTVNLNSSVENANEYRVRIDTIKDGRVLDDYKFDSWFMPDSYPVSVGSDLEPGTYRVRVYAIDTTYEYGESDPVFVDIEVLENNIPAPTIQVSAANLYVGQNFIFTASASQGDFVEFSFLQKIEGQSYSSDWSTTYSLVNGKAEYGTSFYSPMTMTIKARTNVNGLWGKYSDPVTVTVLSIGKLSTPSVDIPQKVDAYKTLKFNVTAQDEAKNFSVYLSYYSEDPDTTPYQSAISIQYLYPDITGGRAYTVSGKDMKPGWYRIEVYAPTVEKWEGSDTFYLTFEAEGNGMPGDINGDETVDLFDLVRLRRYIVDNTVEVFANTDTNGDGETDLFDLIRLRRYIVDNTVEIY